MTRMQLPRRFIFAIGAIPALAANLAIPALAANPALASLGVAKEAARLGKRLAATMEDCKERDLNGRWGDGQRALGPSIRKFESALLKLLKQHPDDSHVTRQLHELYDDWCAAPDPPAPAAFAAIAAAADPVGLSMNLAGGSGMQGATRLMLAALERRPDAAALWLEAANGAKREDWKIALTAQAVRSLLAGGGGQLGETRRRVAAAVAEEELTLELKVGLIDRAARQLALLPEAVRALIESGETGAVQAVVGDAGGDGKAGGIGTVNVHGDLVDLRLELALLRLAHGDAPGAASILAAAKPEPPEPSPAGGGGQKPESDSERQAREDRQEAQRTWSWYRVLEIWRQPAPEDPYDVLLAGYWAARSQARCMGLAMVARQERYPALAAFLERPLADELRHELEGPVLGGHIANADPRVPAPAAADLAALQAEITALAGQMEARARASVAEARAALGPDVAAAAVARSLQAPLRNPFSKHPLPRGVAPLGPKEMVRRRTRAMHEVKLPARFSDLEGALDILDRVERQGSRAVAFVRSVDYGGSAYSVILSSDGGTTWSQPLYTGLIFSQPYVVRAASNLPLLAGDRLQIEVEEVAPESSSAPPRPGPGPVANTTGSYLEIPIAELERDSDGDGLTDLVEERLLTDPLDPDTDRDGVPDGQDLLPQVAAAAPRAAPAASLAVAALVAQVFEEEGRAPEGVAVYPKFQFWEAERPLFASLLQSPNRFIVLSHEEMDQATDKFGWFLHYSLDLFMIDRAGRHAFGIWNYDPNYGGVIELEEVDGKWKAKEIAPWIS
jgi:hypothetical protein